MSNFDDLPPFDPRGLTPEQVRRLVEARVAHLKRMKARGDLPPEHFNCRSSAFIPLLKGVADEVIKRAFETARLKLEDRAAGIPEGDPNELGDWNALKDVLGEETLERLRNGKDT